MILLMVSCDGNRAVSTNGVSDTAPAAEAEGPQRSQDRVNSIEQSITASRAKKKSHQNVITIENYGEKRFLMAGKSNPVVPEDFVLGKIVDAGLKPDSAEAAVALFFDGYRAGKISKSPADYFMGDNSTLLTMLFDEWHNSRFFPAEVRIGNGIASIEILPVWAHVKRGRTVGSHLHLNVSYLFEADEKNLLRMAPEENSGVQWLEMERIDEYCTEPEMIPIYKRLFFRTNIC